MRPTGRQGRTVARADGRIPDRHLGLHNEHRSTQRETYPKGVL